MTAGVASSHADGTPRATGSDGAARPERRALVLGATGHIGNAIVRELAIAGWRVSAATRRSRPAALAGLAVSLAVGDADDPGRLESWIAGHDAVFDAAAPYPLHLFARRSAAEREPLRHGRMRMQRLLAACKAEGAALLHVSSFTTRPRGGNAIDSLEDRLRRRLHPYYETKAAMEGLALQAAAAGQPVAVLTPTACLGPWDRRPRELCVVPLLAGEEVPVLAARTINVVDVREVARAARAAIEQRRFGEALLVAGHDCATGDLAARVCRIAGVRPPSIKVGARPAAAAMLAIEGFWGLLGWPSPVPAIGALLVATGYPLAPSAAQRELGALPRPLDETLADSVAWYRALGYC